MIRNRTKKTIRGSGRTGYPALNIGSKDATSAWDWALVRKYSAVEPAVTIEPGMFDKPSASFVGQRAYLAEQYPIFKVNFKTDNTNSLAHISIEGTVDGSYKSLGLVVENGKIKIEKTKDDEKQTLAIADNNILASTWYTAEFEYSPTSIKTYVYKQGDPKPAYPSSSLAEEVDYKPHLSFKNYRGNTYIDNASVSTKWDTTRYAYDALNRLTEVKAVDGTTQAGYTYDEQGNRLTKTNSTGTTNYQYSAANELQSTTLNSNATNYTYDANGNTLTKVESSQTTNYTYDNKNQLVKVVKPNADIVEYTYDGNGNRYSKTINGTARYYHYDTGGNIVSETDASNNVLVRYVRDNSGKAISMIQSSNTYYFIYNGHGDVTSLTDNTGAVVATYTYDEFGNTTSTTGTVYNPLRYSGANNAYYDSETSLYKMGARYYQSDVGRWLTRDSYQGDKENLQSRNRYVYVGNNPLKYSDPSGHFAWGVVFEVARIVGVAVAVYYTWRFIKSIKPVLRRNKKIRKKYPDYTSAQLLKATAKTKEWKNFSKAFPTFAETWMKIGMKGGF